MKKVIYLIFITIVSVNINMQAAIFGNQIPPDEGETTSLSTDGYVEQAAREYFNGIAELNLYFAKVEVSGLNSGKEYLDNASKYLKSSIDWFKQKRESVMLTPFQIEKYKNFDYQIFLDDPKYHETVMRDVIDSFSKADIKGFFQKIIKLENSMIDIIERLKVNPNIDDVWELYHLSDNPIGFYGTLVSKKIFNNE